MRSALRRLAAVGVAVSAFSLGNPVPAFADERECWFDDIAGIQRCRITAGPGGPDAQRTYDSVPIQWRRWVTTPNFCFAREVINGIETDVEGVPWEVELVNTDTGEVVYIGLLCEWPGEDPPVPPPPPPTPEAYVEAIESLLDVSFELSPPPAFEGITGVDTWFWCSTPEPAVIDPITLNGWTVEAEMKAILYSWSVSGPGLGGSHDSPTCGTEPALDGDGDGAAWIWQPQTMGEYTIGFISTWLGTWTQTYNGVNVGTFPLGPAPIAQEPLTYPVGEYVGVLVPGGDE